LIWLFLLLFVVAILVVTWHYLLPERLCWLSEPQLTAIKTFLFSGAVASVAGRYLSNRIGWFYKPIRSKWMKTEAEWRAEKEFKRDEAERKRAAATEPKEERRWRAARDNYKRQLTMGQERMSDVATKAAETRRR
jgi:hypothetical protein